MEVRYLPIVNCKQCPHFVVEDSQTGGEHYYASCNMVSNKKRQLSNKHEGIHFNCPLPTGDQITEDAAVYRFRDVNENVWDDDDDDEYEGVNNTK